MRVFILHHHFDQSGVTKVIHSQLKSYKNLNILPTLLSGREISNPIFNSFPKYIFPELDYFNFRHEPRQALVQKVNTIIDFLKIHIQKSEILHIHNLNLGKNPLLNIAILSLLEQGFKIVNHCHDFAEDMRLNLFQQLKTVFSYFKIPLFETLYPQYNNLVYITINSRDFHILNNDLNLSPRVKLLTNPIETMSNKINQDFTLQRQQLQKKFNIPNNHNIILYPVRAIRRKNIGEILLLSTLYKESSTWLITQPPKNETEKNQYFFWKECVQNLQLPIVLAAGEEMNFETLCMGSDCFVTTSVMEGFGMTFLEPWVFGKPLIGRSIPSLTKDFKELGIKLENLYSNIKIPTDWVINVDALKLDYQQYLKNTYKDMNLPLENNLPILNSNSSWIDFARLDLKNQAHIIKLVFHNPKKKEHLMYLNNLQNNLSLKSTFIKENESIIINKFNLTSYGLFLSDIYKNLNQQNTQNNIKSTSKTLSSDFSDWTKHFISHDRFYLLLQ